MLRAYAALTDVVQCGLLKALAWPGGVFIVADRAYHCLCPPLVIAIGSRNSGSGVRDGCPELVTVFPPPAMQD